MASIALKLQELRQRIGNACTLAARPVQSVTLLAVAKTFGADAVRGAYLNGLSYEQLAARHDVPLNTMRSWLRRGLLSLKECLER